MRRIWIVIGSFLLLIVIGISGYLGFHSDRSEVSVTPVAPETISVSICDVTQSVSAPGSVIFTRRFTVNMPVSASLVDVLVQPGDEVLEDQPLINLSQEDVALAMAEAKMEVIVAQEGLATANHMLANLSYPRANNLTLELARINLASAEAVLENAQQEYDNASQLPASDTRLMAAIGALVTAKQNRDRALGTLNWYSGHASDLENAAATAGVDLAKAKLARTMAALAALEGQFRTGEAISSILHASSRGVVLRVMASAGESLAAGAPVLTIVDPTGAGVEAYVVEEDFPYLTVGQAVTVYFDALPELEESGVVSRILPERVPGDSPQYAIHITLDQVPEHLAEGMTADASIIIAERTQVLCLPRAQVHASTGSTAIVQVWNGDTIESRQIRIGLRGDVYVEILSGVVEGEQVLAR